MDQRAFTNAVKILHSIDRHELAEAGIELRHDDRLWVAFRERPVEWFIRASDEDAAKVWAIIQSRMGGR